MKNLIFRGAGVAIITPFTEDGIHFSELARLIEFQIANGTDAIIITGTSGESATMTDEEHKAAIKFAVEQLQKSNGLLSDFSKVLARTLKKYIPDGESSGEKCTKCGEKLVFQNGCRECPTCGESYCA